jgi:serine/threonine-protein phosphatase PP1 catalytic subunit
MASDSSDESCVVNIDGLITRLWDSIKKPSDSAILTLPEIRSIITTAQAIIVHQPVFLELVPPLTVCGDIHGQFFDLLRIFEQCGDPGNTNYLFLGDYVDRGPNSVNTVCLLLLYKIRYPENFFLLRGNHETSQMNLMYGFLDECKGKYSKGLWKKFNGLFDWLPMAAMIDNRILCVHGGIGPDLQSLDQLREIKRPLEIPETGLECDLTWADPEPTCDSWGTSSRMTSVVFGQQPARKLLETLGLDTIFRAHQAIAKGFEFPFDPWTGVLTIFSAPNYGGTFGNAGAVVAVNSDLRCSFVVFEPKHSAILASLITRPPQPGLGDSGTDADGDVAVKRFALGRRASKG